MATLVFRVSAQYDEVIKLRNEISKLEAQLKKMDVNKSPAAAKALETQLASTRQQMMGLVTEAAKAGAEIENGFKKKIYDASQTVNGLSEKIIAQRAVIKDIEFDVKRLGDAYRTALKNNPIGASGKLAEYNAARKALDEEKAALFGLTQQQAEARLSVKKLRDEYSLYKKEAGDTVEINNGLSLSWGKMLGVIGGATALKSLASQIVRVRGEFQSMQTAIETMVGKDVASGLMAQLKEMAKISPLTLTDMVNAEKMMLGFNIQAEDTARYLQALSDISMGDSVKFKSLTLAFSQMSAAGKLMGQDLNQMINAGFNPLQIIAEKTGKSISTLKDEMSKGAVSAEMVQQAFIDATSAGGKFYQMSENASKTINGQLSMMQDALDNAFNEMGQASEGVIMEGIQLTTTLIQNYETVGKVLVGLVATYGAYRTAVMLATIATSKHTIAEVALTNARVIARKAQLLLNAAMLTNPYVAVATVVTALVATMWTLSDSTSSAAKATREYNQAKEEAGKKEEEHKRRIDELLTSSRDESLATLTRQKSLEELRKEYPKIFEQYDLEKLKLEDILNIKRQINEEDSKQKVEKTKNDYYSLKETVSNQQRYLTLYDNPELRKNMSDEDMNIWRMFAGKQSYVEVREQMQKDAEKLKLLQRDVIADNIASYKANLKEFSEERLKVELQMAQSEASKRNGFNVGGIMVKGGDLAGIITSINNEIENRKPQTTYQQDLAVAKEDWEKAKKGYEALIKDQKATSEQVKKAREEMEVKEKTYKELGGITGSSLTKQEQLAEALLQLRFQNQQDEINLMQEGSEKKRKQIELDYKKELAEIKKIEKEWSEKNGGKLAQDQSVEISIKYSNAENKRKEGLSGLVEEEQQKLQSMLEKYQDYAAQREAIEKQLNEDITYLETQRTEENSANIDRAIKVAKEKAAKAVKEITDEESKALVNDSGIFARLFSDSSSMTKASLKKVIAEAKTLVEYLSGISIEKPLGFTEDQLEALKGDAESIKEIYDALIEKQDELDKRTDYPFDGIVKGFRKIKESSELAKRAIEETNEEKKKLLQSQSEAEYGKGVSYLKDGALEASDAVGFLAEQVSILAEATGDAKFKEFSDQFSAFSQNLQAAGQGAQSGGWIGAIVGGASDMITQTVASMAQLQSEAYEYEQNRIDFLREIEKISLSLKDEDYDSIFGTSSIEKARDAYDLAREALEKYNEELQRTSALELEEEYKNLGAAIFAPIFGSFGFGKRISEETKALMAAYEKGYTDLQAMAVKTKDRSGWANFWGKKDEYTALKDLAPELWNEDGTFNVEAAQAFLDTNTQISDEQRKQIQNVIDLKNAYDENIAIIDELLASTFGSLGSDITDIIFDSVRNGTDAWEQFREVGSEIIDELGRQMIQELYVQTYLETFKERMRAAYGLDSVEDTQKELANIMNDIYNGLEGVLDGASSAAEEWDKWAKDHGFTPGEEDTESSSQTATSKGFTTMSQDTADELNGRFTALYESNLRLETIGQQQAIAITELRGPISSLTAQASGMYNIADETRTILANSYLELQQIRENTGEIVKPIKQMQADIAEVKRNTSRL